jgi:8-oxo-dGTP pyrophosphatase MutT (NUDIX family)
MVYKENDWGSNGWNSISSNKNRANNDGSDKYNNNKLYYRKIYDTNDRRRCINCDEVGHVYKKCSKPITSHGILAYKRDKSSGELLYLLIKRKDSIGYIDFLRSKINKNLNREDNIRTLVEEMSTQEKETILTTPFDTLWDNLWCNYKSKLYINEYKKSKINFYKLDIQSIMNDTISKWDTQEFCIPKGRRNSRESPYNCSIREFMEETGYEKNEFHMLGENIKIEELFLGSNGLYYKHIYYIACIKTDRVPVVDPENISQAGEVKSLHWVNFKQAINSFRIYEYTKRAVIYKARKIINNISNQLLE